MEKNNENENVSVEPPKNQEGKYVIDKNNPTHIRWLHQQQANRGAKAVNQGRQKAFNIQQNFRNNIGFVPGIGDILDFGLTGYEVATGKEKPIMLGLSALGFLPFGDVVKKAKLTKHLQGDDAVKMFKEYGGTSIPEESINGWQLQQYVNEARERYGLVGRTDITDQEIAEALYKHVNELGSNTAAKNIQGEPQLLFRGDTKNYEELKDRLTPDELAAGTGTMDNSLGTLFLGEFPGSYIDKESAVGASRYLHGSYLDINGWQHRSSGTSNSTAANNPGYRMFLNNRGRRGNVMGFIKDASTEDSPNWLNAFVVRTPEIRNATSEISVLNDDNLRMGVNGATYKGTQYQYDPETYSMIESKTGKNLGEVVSEDVTLPEDRAVMADHYNEVLKDAENKKQGLLKSDNKSPLRHEHWAYSYFALPNFNKHNAKHILPFDLRIPRDWKDPNIFRLGVPLTIGLGYKYYNQNNDKN